MKTAISSIAPRSRAVTAMGQPTKRQSRTSKTPSSYTSKIAWLGKFRASLERLKVRSGSLPGKIALRARAQVAQVIEGINSCGVAIVPIDLEGVTSDQFRALWLQRLDAEHGQQARRAVMRLASLGASCAWTTLAEAAVRIHAGMTVRPEDRKRVVPGVEFDFGWEVGHRIKSPLSVVVCPLHSYVGESQLTTDD